MVFAADIFRRMEEEQRRSEADSRQTLGTQFAGRLKDVVARG